MQYIFVLLLLKYTRHGLSIQSSSTKASCSFEVCGMMANVLILKGRLFVISKCKGLEAKDETFFLTGLVRSLVFYKENIHLAVSVLLIENAFI